MRVLKVVDHGRALLARLGSCCRRKFHLPIAPHLRLLAAPHVFTHVHSLTYSCSINNAFFSAKEIKHGSHVSTKRVKVVRKPDAIPTPASSRFTPIDVGGVSSRDGSTRHGGSGHQQRNSQPSHNSIVNGAASSQHSQSNGGGGARSHESSHHRYTCIHVYMYAYRQYKHMYTVYLLITNSDPVL